MNSIDIIKELNSIVNDVNEKIENLPEMQRLCDLQQQDILHFIEGKKLNATQMSRIIRLLKRTRRNRREYKNELSLCVGIKQKLSNDLTSGIDVENIDTYYEFKTDVLKDFGFDIGDRLVFEHSNKLPNTIETCDCVNTTASMVDNNQDTSISSKDIIDDVLASYNDFRRIKITKVCDNSTIIVGGISKAINIIMQERYGKIKLSEFTTNVLGIIDALQNRKMYLGYSIEYEEN